MTLNTAQARQHDFEHFIQTLQESGKLSLHSAHLVGSILTDDFEEKGSDINSILVLDAIDMAVMATIVSLGSQFRIRSVAAPYLMTPAYIASSLDVFPLEFFNFQLLHQTVFGPDLLAGVQIDPRHLRLQCERESKSRYLWLQQGYIRCLGEPQGLFDTLKASITGFLPLLRGILAVAGRPASGTCQQVAKEISGLAGRDFSIFATVFQLRHRSLAPDTPVRDYFASYYQASQKVMELVDGLVL